MVLLFKVRRISRHSVLYSEEEGQSGVIPTRLPSCHYVPHLVDWCQVGRRRSRLVYRLHLCIDFIILT